MAAELDDPEEAAIGAELDEGADSTNAAWKVGLESDGMAAWKVGPESDGMAAWKVGPESESGGKLCKVAVNWGSQDWFQAWICHYTNCSMSTPFICETIHIPHAPLMAK